jgi:hypothetical protein
MKITEEYDENISEIITVKSAKYIGDFTIRILFDNGYSRLVDFKPFMEKSYHPVIKKYLDEEQFSKFNIVDGNLNWNDYEMIFPVYDLYIGEI